jgi:hypothetical protein
MHPYNESMIVSAGLVASMAVTNECIVFRISALQAYSRVPPLLVEAEDSTPSLTYRSDCCRRDLSVLDVKTRFRREVSRLMGEILAPSPKELAQNTKCKQNNGIKSPHSAYL